MSEITHRPYLCPHSESPLSLFPASETGLPALPSVSGVEGRLLLLFSRGQHPRPPCEAHSFWMCADNFISVFVLWAAIDFQPLLSVGFPCMALHSEKTELVLNIFVYFHKVSPCCKWDIAAGWGG